jgi:hypothetical protein
MAESLFAVVPDQQPRRSALADVVAHIGRARSWLDAKPRDSTKLPLAVDQLPQAVIRLSWAAVQPA